MLIVSANADFLETYNIGWTPDNQEVGAAFTNKLARYLWYLDPHHQKFVNRGVALPVKFKDIMITKERKKKSQGFQPKN